MRTISEVDYECEIDITTESSREIALLIVIRFPNAIRINCQQNPYAFTILKKDECVRLCEEISMKDSTPFFFIALSSKIRFRFVSNSSINTDMQVSFVYEILLLNLPNNDFNRSSPSFLKSVNDYNTHNNNYSVYLVLSIIKQNFVKHSIDSINIPKTRL